jgi:hypothetical protein
MDDYLLCGWRVRSALALPELIPWSGDDRAPDVLLRFGCATLGRCDLVAVSPVLQIDRYGSARLSIEGVASYVVRDGQEVIIDPMTDPASPDIRVFLFGAVLGMLCHQRGLLPLRAACVAVDAKAMALAGAAARGKSTLAASVALRGHALVADSVCVIDPFAPGGPVVLPAFPYVSLWRNTADALALSERGRLPNRLGQEKYRYPIGERLRFPAAPIPLTAVYVLEWTNRVRKAELIDLSGAQCAVAFRRLLFPRRTGGMRGLDARFFRATAVLTKRCRTSRLIHDYGFPAAHATGAMLERRIRS